MWRIDCGVKSEERTVRRLIPCSRREMRELGVAWWWRGRVKSGYVLKVQLTGLADVLDVEYEKYSIRIFGMSTWVV